MDLPKGRYFAYVTSKTSSAGEYGEQESAPSNIVDFIIDVYKRQVLMLPMFVQPVQAF